MVENEEGKGEENRRGHVPSSFQQKMPQNADEVETIKKCHALENKRKVGGKMFVVVFGNCKQNCKGNSNF